MQNKAAGSGCPPDLEALPQLLELVASGGGQGHGRPEANHRPDERDLIQASRVPPRHARSGSRDRDRGAALGDPRAQRRAPLCTAPAPASAATTTIAASPETVLVIASVTTAATTARSTAMPADQAQSLEGGVVRSCCGLTEAGGRMR